MEVLNFIRESWPGCSDSRFPGPQPVSIERRHFPLLKHQPYLVCEKTDGVRHLLASTDEGVFLINRALVIDKVNVRLPKNTLLDGELVETKKGGRLFIVYDAVRVKGQSLMNVPLDARLEAARKVVKTIIKTSNAPFEIRTKTMWHLGDPIPDLNSFEYETDGLVFTPIHEPIRTGTHETMFKWKPRDRITVDFQLKNGDELFVQEKGILHKESLLHRPNVRKDIPDGAIVECGYGDLGWFVEKIRTDKTYPNNRRTFVRTCVNLREAIALEEFTSGTRPGTTPLS